MHHVYTTYHIIKILISCLSHDLTGNSGETCGGTDHMTVFRARSIDERTPTNITVEDTLTSSTDPTRKTPVWSISLNV